MTQNARSKKIYSTLATLAAAAIIASVPVAAEATSYLDIYSSPVSLNNASATDHDFTGMAVSYKTSPAGSPIDVNAYSATSFSLNYDSGINSGGFSITDDNGATTLLHGLVTGLAVPVADWTTDTIFTFSIDSATGTLNSGQSWVGTVYINLNGGGYSDAIVSAPVPEPATMSLLLLGGSALAGLRRRRKASIA